MYIWVKYKHEIEESCCFSVKSYKSPTKWFGIGDLVPVSVK